ncbi:MAG: hypothetical protein HLUCCA11_20380 [Phormidesmis priestleyi Ana]|uniref:Uncharacterized protein n=1 Tax=Phormidesmis priestleyi Ana TaxID=1666911 RepID=A0A0P8D9V1_9CYAN|nr:MAG: hypothetical protein HLUCCA11_20380 [Phormidesmis priestleyi Ana]
MKKYVKLVTTAIIMAIAIILLSPRESTAQAVPARVETVYRSTAAVTEVPLRVPSVIPLTSPAVPAEYWASSIAPRADRYIISFDRAENCENVEECSFAVVEGALAANSPTSFQQLSAQPRNENIVLSDGTPAVFSPAIEGLYTPASVFIQVGNYLYSFSIYMADKTDVLEMVNSAEIFSE